MKKCKYCAEEVKDEAIKCKHCHSSLIHSNEDIVRINTNIVVFRLLKLFFYLILINCGIAISLFIVGETFRQIEYANLKKEADEILKLQNAQNEAEKQAEKYRELQKELQIKNEKELEAKKQELEKVYYAPSNVEKYEYLKEFYNTKP